MLPLAGCSVVRHTVHQRGEAGEVHSYVLSESSLFVYKRVVLLKTCGRTTLLRCLSSLLSLVEEASEKRLEWDGGCFSRCNYLFPLEQVPEHQNWAAEIDLFKRMLLPQEALFQQTDAASESKFQAWHLAVASRKRILPRTTIQNQEKKQNKAITISPTVCNQLLEQATSGFWLVLEVAMYELHVDVMQPFYWQEGDSGTLSSSGAACFKRSGLSSLFPLGEFDIVDHVFQPCGYSCNGVRYGNTCGSDHLSIHVTPEPGQTFLSLEVGWCAGTKPKQVLALAERAIAQVFRPGRCSVALFYGGSNTLENADGCDALQHFVTSLAKQGWTSRRSTDATMNSELSLELEPSVLSPPPPVRLWSCAFDHESATGFCLQ